MCTCHDRDIDHAFDDDIDQYVVPGSQNTPPELTTATETGAQAAKATQCVCGCHKHTGAVGGSSWAVEKAGEVIVTDPDALKELLAYLAADKNEQEDE